MKLVISARFTYQDPTIMSLHEKILLNKKKERRKKSKNSTNKYRGLSQNIYIKRNLKLRPNKTFFFI